MRGSYLRAVFFYFQKLVDELWLYPIIKLDYTQEIIKVLLHYIYSGELTLRGRHLLPFAEVLDELQLRGKEHMHITQISEGQADVSAYHNEESRVTGSFANVQQLQLRVYLLALNAIQSRRQSLAALANTCAPDRSRSRSPEDLGSRHNSRARDESPGSNADDKIIDVTTQQTSFHSNKQNSSGSSSEHNNYSDDEVSMQMMRYADPASYLSSIVNGNAINNIVNNSNTFSTLTNSFHSKSAPDARSDPHGANNNFSANAINKKRTFTSIAGDTYDINSNEADDLSKTESEPGLEEPQPKKAKYQCDKCLNKWYSTIGNLNRHKDRECGVEPQFKCNYCDKKYRHSHSLKKHVEKRHRI